MTPVYEKGGATLVRLDGHLLRVEEVDGARIVQVAALRNPG